MQPVSRDDLIRRLHRLGFDGPFSGGKHAFMIRGKVRLPLPNPHGSDIGTGLLKRILRKAGVTLPEWERSK